MFDVCLPAAQAIFTGLDFEGSGLSETHPDSPVQIGMATMRGTEICTQTVSFLNIDHEVTREAYRIHRIDRSQCVEAPTLHSFWAMLRETSLSTVFVAHNASTERRYLKNAFPLWNLNQVAWIDTLKLSRIAWPDAESHQLEAVVARIGREALHTLFSGRTWHDALFDAAGSLMILRHLLALPGWESFLIRDLVKAHPKAWHAAKVQSRQKPLRMPSQR